MKRISKTIITLIFIIVTMQLSIVAFAAPNIPTATSDFYVNDFANVFSAEEKSNLMERAVELSNTSDGIQVVITTVKSLDGNTVEDYSYAMYNQYGIGKDNMGLLILLATEDREIRVEVGKNMEAYINDSKAGRFMDKYAIPKLKENKFNEGLISLQTELINEIKTCINNSNTPANSDKTPVTVDWSTIGFWLLVIAIFGILGIIVLIICRKSKKIKDLQLENDNLRSKIQTIRIQADNDIEQVKKGTSNIIKQKEALDKQYYDLNSRFDILNDRYERGKILFPDLDSKVDAMIEEEIRQKDIAKADSVDNLIQQIINLPASKENLFKFDEAISSYNYLTDKQKSYVKSDISKVCDLYKRSTQLKYQHLASVAVASITAIISGISVGKEKHIRDLKEAKGIYDELGSESKKYVDNNIPKKISNLLSQALQDKKDREDREEEEERLRRQRQNTITSSSYHSGFGGHRGGGFGGFGGGTGGGGASRRF